LNGGKGRPRDRLRGGLRDDVSAQGEATRQRQGNLQARTSANVLFLKRANQLLKTPKCVAGGSGTVAKHNVSGGAALKTPAGLTVQTAL
jgi:hypothetical protein